MRFTVPHPQSLVLASTLRGSSGENSVPPGRLRAGHNINNLTSRGSVRSPANILRKRWRESAWPRGLTLRFFPRATADNLGGRFQPGPGGRSGPRTITEAVPLD
jgi:hypothetical protein